MVDVARREVVVPKPLRRGSVAACPGSNQNPPQNARKTSALHDSDAEQRCSRQNQPRTTSLPSSRQEKPNQNKIDKQFTAAQLANIDAALSALETELSDLTIPTPQDKARSAKPPEGAGDWMTKMVTMAGLNLDKLPAAFTVAAVQQDLDLEAQLRERQVRLEAIMNRVNGGIFQAGSDAFAACLNIRRDLIDGGVPDVDNDLDEGMSSYFRRTKSTPPPP